MPRAQTPPPNWSGSGLGGLPINAEDWLRKAVLAASIAETSELIDPPEANGTKAVAGKGLPPMKSPGTVDVQGVCAAAGAGSSATAATRQVRIAPIWVVFANRLLAGSLGGADLAPNLCLIIFFTPKSYRRDSRCFGLKRHVSASYQGAIQKSVSLLQQRLAKYMGLWQ
jgi:hypothetical protein